MPADRLKLIALDAEDLQAISACCQDAVLKTADLHYFSSEKRFILEMNRFVWEKAPGPLSQPERRKAVLHFERVEKVSLSGIDRSNRDQVLSLLAIIFEPGDGPGGTVQLVFAGKAAIRLSVECIEAQLSDMKASWAASSIPSHPQE